MLFKVIVYLTTNQINNKRYVGQSIHNDSEYFGSGTLIRRAINKYGIENFRRIVLWECSDHNELDIFERYFIDFLNTMVPNGYNLEGGGRANYPVSQALRDKTSKIMEEKWKGSEYRESQIKKIFGGKVKKGRKPWNIGLTKETDERVANNCVNRDESYKRTPEFRKKISDNNPMKQPAARAKMAATRKIQQKEMWQDPEYKEMMLTNNKFINDNPMKDPEIAKKNRAAHKPDCQCFICKAIRNKIQKFI